MLTLLLHVYSFKPAKLLINIMQFRVSRAAMLRAAPKFCLKKSFNKWIFCSNIRPQLQGILPNFSPKVNLSNFQLTTLEDKIKQAQGQNSLAVQRLVNHMLQRSDSRPCRAIRRILSAVDISVTPHEVKNLM